MESSTTNEKINDRYLGLLNKLPFSTGQPKGVVEKILFLSQKNACMDLLFSINEQKLRTNLKDQSSVTREYQNTEVFWKWT